jgi:DNA-binding transcriptional MerR regulator
MGTVSIAPTDQGVTRLLGLKELAALWQVSPHTIRFWVKTRGLRPTRISSRLLRFTPQECERFLAACGKQQKAS